MIMILLSTFEMIKKQQVSLIYFQIIPNKKISCNDL
jgi:hypothetical protein